MKKHPFTKLSLLFIAFLFSSLLVAQNSKFDFNQFEKRNVNQQLTSFNIVDQIAAVDVKYLPTLATNYYWDTLTKSYFGGNLDAMKYNSLGKLILKTSFYPNSTDSSSKTLYKYYPNEGGQEVINLYWKDGGWDSVSKTVTLLDKYGNETEGTNYSWQSITKDWKIMWSNKGIYKYDNQGRLIERVSIQYNDGVYSNRTKAVHTFPNINDKAFNTFVSYDWKNNEWIPSRRALDIVWKDFDNLDYISFIQQLYINNVWVNNDKAVRTYTGNNYIEIAETYINGKWINRYTQTFSTDKEGNNTSITQVYDVTGMLINESKHLEFVDSKGKDAGSSFFKWANNEWMLDISNLYTNTYNANGALVEKITEQISTSYSGKSKIVYSDFVTITTGIADRTVAEILSVFPIPAKDFITISPLVNETLTFKIYNGQGTEIPTDFSSSKIDVSQWTKGIYFLHIRTAEGNSYTKKLIKE